MLEAEFHTIGEDSACIFAPRVNEFDAELFEGFTNDDVLYGLDVETGGIRDKGPGLFDDDLPLKLVQVASRDEAWVLRVDDVEQRAAIVKFLSDQSKHFVTHTTYDALAVFAKLGVDLLGRFVDTHLMSLLIIPGDDKDHGLKPLCDANIDDGLSKAKAALDDRFYEIVPKDERGKLRKGSPSFTRLGFDFVSCDDDVFCTYAGLDAIYVRRLFDIIKDECSERFPWLSVREQELSWLATGIGFRGIKLDKHRAELLNEEIGKEKASLESSLRELTGLAPRSPKRVDWLKSRGVAFTSVTDTGQPSLDRDAVEELVSRYKGVEGAGMDEVRECLRLSLELSLVSNTATNIAGFVQSADVNGRVHPNVKTLGAKTGRMSVTRPALQTIKKRDKRMRRCFVADEGMSLIACDFSQVELRVAAALSCDETMSKVIRDGLDLHDETARMIFGNEFSDEQRSICKTVNFGTVYGGGVSALVKNAGIDEGQARDTIARWRETYPQLAKFTREMGKQLDGVVVTEFGREIPVDDGRPYANGNYMIQSTARDLFVGAVLKLCFEDQLHSSLWMMIHDEVIFQVPTDDVERVVGLVEDAMTMTYRGVPISAESTVYGSRWLGEDDDEEVAA